MSWIRLQQQFEQDVSDFGRADLNRILRHIKGFPHSRYPVSQKSDLDEN